MIFSKEYINNIGVYVFTPLYGVESTSVLIYSTFYTFVYHICETYQRRNVNDYLRMTHHEGPSGLLHRVKKKEGESFYESISYSISKTYSLLLLGWWFV